MSGRTDGVLCKIVALHETEEQLRNMRNPELPPIVIENTEWNNKYSWVVRCGDAYWNDSLGWEKNIRFAMKYTEEHATSIMKTLVLTKQYPENFNGRK